MSTKIIVTLTITALDSVAPDVNKLLEDVQSLTLADEVQDELRNVSVSATYALALDD